MNALRNIVVLATVVAMILAFVPVTSAQESFLPEIPVGVPVQVQSTSGLNVRPQPNTTQAAVASLNYGTIVRATWDAESGWWKIVEGEYADHYISGSENHARLSVQPLTYIVAEAASEEDTDELGIVYAVASEAVSVNDIYGEPLGTILAHQGLPVVGQSWSGETLFLQVDWHRIAVVPAESFELESRPYELRTNAPNVAQTFLLGDNMGFSMPELMDLLDIQLVRVGTEFAAAAVNTGGATSYTRVCPLGFACEYNQDGVDLIIVGDGEEQFSFTAATLRFMPAYPAGDFISRDFPYCNLLQNAEELGRLSQPTYPVEPYEFNCVEPQTASPAPAAQPPFDIGFPVQEIVGGWLLPWEPSRGAVTFVVPPAWVAQVWTGSESCLMVAGRTVATGEASFYPASEIANLNANGIQVCQ